MKNIFRNSKLSIVLTLAALTALGIAGCKKEEKKAKLATPAGIEWHKAGIVSALQLAKKENRPLFVYWGAQWCPPCNVVKATVFTDSDFITATKKFIPVYLDGDTESAQEWGEKLNAAGYPTLMVLNSEGKEVVRLSTEMSPKEFAESLSSVYTNLHPIDELIAKTLKASSAATDQKTWQILAGYSWAQAKNYKGKIDWAESYSKLEKKIPAKYELEKERLFLNGFLARTQSMKKEEELSEKERNSYLKRVGTLVNEAKLFSRHHKVFSYYSAEIVKSLFDKKSDERDTFIKSFKSSLAASRAQYKSGSHGRLISFYPLVELAGIEGEALSPAEKELIKKEMLQAVEKIDSSYEQVFVSSGSSYILREAGLGDVARTVLLKDIKNSKTPYYAMASLASLEKKSGNKDEAIKWIERAYNTSKGNATRLQWGSNYLIYMMELTPDKKDKILRELQKFYRVHLKQSDAFMGRNKSRLGRIAKKVQTWSKSDEIRKPLKSLRQKWMDSCETKSKTKTEYYRKGCRDYFSGLLSAS